MQKSGIYIIYSQTKPERIYVGSAVSLRRRKLRHFRELRNGTHFNQKLLNYAAKYGADDLTFQILEYCPVEDLIQREQYWLNLLPVFFNINPIAASRLGAKQSNQTKLRISKASKASPKENIFSRYARLTSKKP